MILKTTLGSLALAAAIFFASPVEAPDSATVIPTNKVGTAIGDTAPEIALSNPKGKTMKLSDLRGSLVLVDFWAEWCGPCKQIGPALEDIANEMDGKVTVAKVNIDDNPGVPTKYGVRGIPTLMLFQNGQVAGTKVGAMPKSKISEWIEETVAANASA